MGVPADDGSSAETPSHVHVEGDSAQPAAEIPRPDEPVDPGMDVDILDDVVMCCVMEQLGACGRSYKRECRRAVRNLVSEVWSPPRVTKLLSKFPTCGLVPGFALDLTVDDELGEAWDFDRKCKRDAALERVRREKPKFLVLSPMCRAFSSWQNLNKINQDPSETRSQKMRAMIHLRFAMELAKEQIVGGRYFVFEHPAMATSWSERCVKTVMDLPDVERVMAHMCQFDYSDPRDGSPLKKPTYFLSNSEEILANLERRCSGTDGLCGRQRGGRHA